MIYFNYPTTRISEANIQAEFYKQCKDSGLYILDNKSPEESSAIISF